MVTMKKPGETSVQSLNLPLTSLTTDTDQTDLETVDKVCLEQLL